MSLPSFPTSQQTITRDEAINQIISSIAMEEIGLSHIINAEGEKLQYALGTIPNQEKPDVPPTIEDLLELNKSINQTLDSAMLNQLFLKDKLSSALSASVLTGPTGAAGPMTTILDSYNTIEALRDAHPTGTLGDAYLVGVNLYVWDDELSDWKNVGDLAGPMGPMGPTGPMGAILDSYNTYNDLVTAHPTGSKGDTYLAGGAMYVWDEGTGTWKNVGDLGGPVGPTGASAYEEAQAQGYTGTVEEWLESLIGPAGPVGAILGRLNSPAELPADATQGDTYLVGDGELYVWLEGSWVSMGSLIGPEGPQGQQGEPGEAIGTIAGVVETEGELPATGNVGELYIVREAVGFTGPQLFVWNDPQGWQHVGDFDGIIGPTGATAAFTL